MLNVQELQSKITSLLAKIHEENAALQQGCVGLPSDTCKIDAIILYIEHMHEIRRQLQELVGDAAIAMIARQLGIYSAWSPDH